MKLVVADTGPLNYLIQIDCIHLLPSLADGVVIPKSVKQELQHPKAPEQVRAWILNPPHWLEIKEDPDPLPNAGISLSYTDLTGIMLASNLNAVLLMDEQAGRTHARGLGVLTIGTLGILEAAARLQLIDFRETIEKLRKTNIRLADSLIEAAFNRLGV